MRAPRPFPEAKDTTIFPNPVATPDMVVLELLGVAGYPSLGSRKIAALGNCIFVKTTPGLLWIPSSHHQGNVSLYITFINYNYNILYKVILHFTYLYYYAYLYKRD